MTRTEYESQHLTYKDICCKRCKKKPNEISEYDEYAKDEGVSNTVYVIENEGTYNPVTKRFYCTDCYVALGCPLGTA